MEKVNRILHSSYSFGCPFAGTLDNGPVADRIEATYARLHTIFIEEEILRKTLDDLFNEEAAEVAEQVRRAQAKAEQVKQKHAKMRKLLEYTFTSLGTTAQEIIPLSNTVITEVLDSDASATSPEIPSPSLTNQGTICSLLPLDSRRGSRNLPELVTHSPAESESSIYADFIPSAVRFRYGDHGTILETPPKAEGCLLFSPDYIVSSQSNSFPRCFMPGLHLSSDERDELVRWFISIIRSSTDRSYIKVAPEFLWVLARDSGWDIGSREW